MEQVLNPDRRTFLKAGIALGGGLALGFYLPAAGRALAAEPEQVFTPNAWIRIARDGQVTLVVDKSEMGQGVWTALPMLLAEELEVDLDQVRLEEAPADQVYANPMFGFQGTGGSTSVRASWDPLRRAGAAARELLIAAAAQAWGVKPSACRAEKGTVMHPGSGRRLGYGALADRAAKLPLPEHIPLKDPKDFKLIGKPRKRLDSAEKVNGKAIFGIDVQVPGMLYATVLRCPVFGGKAASFDASKAKQVKGVRQVVEIDSGIAVVADHYWAAKQGRDALEVKWDDGSNGNLTSEAIARRFQEAARTPGAVARSEGDVGAALNQAYKLVEATYEVPFLAHATMEPMNCTAYVSKDRCEVWAPTQAQTFLQQTAAKIAGLKPEQVRVHTTFLGGGFGRRFEQDFVAEAVAISKAVEAPVKVIWSREDDIQHDFYRPATYNVLRGVLDQQGNPIAWQHRIVGPSILSRVFPARVKNGVDPTSVEGAYNIPYAVPNVHVDYVKVDTGVPVGFWRSVGSSQNAFITESFIDELAHAAGKDPFEFRRGLLSNKPRHKAVLELAAEQAGWDKPLSSGRYRGIAVHESFASFVAQVAEVSVGKDGSVRVHRVVCAVDCGQTVNPATVVAQMESAIAYGLTAALKGEITIKDGRVVQSNFNDYPLLRLNEMPEVEVHIVPSDAPPGGVGEPGTPPIAPAVANAVFAATGKRLRRLPIRAEELKQG